MRTTLDIDDDLMNTLETLHPGKSKTELIEMALKAYLAVSSNFQLRRFAGQLQLTDLRGAR